MNLVKQGMNSDEAIENTVKTLFTTIPVSENMSLLHKIKLFSD